MEHHQALPSSDLTMTANDSNNNNSMHYHHSNRRKRRTTKQQQFASSTSTSTSTGIRLGEKAAIFSMSITDDQLLPLKRPLSWTKRWSKWFSACSADHRSTASPSQPIQVSASSIYFSLQSIVSTCCAEFCLGVINRLSSAWTVSSFSFLFFSPALLHLIFVCLKDVMEWRLSRR